MLILAFESSCDETSVAIASFENGEKKVLANKTATQIAIHALYGGVVPEIAGRAHIEVISALTYAAFEEAGVTVSDIDYNAVYTVKVSYSPLKPLEDAKRTALIKLMTAEGTLDVRKGLSKDIENKCGSVESVKNMVVRSHLTALEKERIIESL